MSDEPRYKPTSDVVARVLDGEAVLLHLGKGEYFGLNAVGTYIWERLAEGATRAELLAAVLERFDVERATAERDLDGLLERLTDRQLIELVSA